MNKVILTILLTLHTIALHGMKLPYWEQKNLNAELRAEAIHGDLEKIKALIKSGADIFAADSHDNTALILAAWGRHPSACCLLVEKMLAPTKSQKKEIGIFFGYLKKDRSTGDYKNLREVFKEQFCKFCKEINAPNTCKEINKIGWEEIKPKLFQILP